MDAAQTPEPPRRIIAPSVGSVHGFLFQFGEQKLRHPHPGIVVASKMGTKDGNQVCGVIALAITHAEQNACWYKQDAIPIPSEELSKMGLDNDAQWICLFEQVTTYFPEGVMTIKSLGKSHLGNASDEFTSRVTEAWTEYRTAK